MRKYASVTRFSNITAANISLFSWLVGSRTGGLNRDLFLGPLFSFSNNKTVNFDLVQAIKYGCWKIWIYTSLTLKAWELPSPFSTNQADFREE